MNRSHLTQSVHTINTGEFAPNAVGKQNEKKHKREHKKWECSNLFCGTNSWAMQVHGLHYSEYFL